MAKYILLLALLLAGCTSRYDAQVAQANANAVQSQALIVQSQENARMFSTLADAAKPTYWPIVLVVIVFVVAMGMAILLVVRWHMIIVSHVAAGRPVHTEELRLLPGQPGFNRELRLAARERGEQAVKRGGAYYLVNAEGQRTPVNQLIVREG